MKYQWEKDLIAIESLNILLKNKTITKISKRKIVCITLD